VLWWGGGVGTYKSLTCLRGTEISFPLKKAIKHILNYEAYVKFDEKATVYLKNSKKDGRQFGIFFF